jgi:AraC-like DNA-binding protein
MAGKVGAGLPGGLKERDMARLKSAPPRGIIRDRPIPGEFAHHRYEVDGPLSASVEHWWSVAWRLPPGERRVRQTLPHPSIHVVQEGQQVTVVGVNRGRFAWTLEGQGRVFAAKFRPGAFRGLLKAPVSTLTDKVVPLAQVVGRARAADYRDRLLSCANDHERVAVAQAFFAALLPPPPADAALLEQLVEAVATDRTVTTVEALRERSGMHLRELQRWFRDAVGISPKWMIQRYRLHEALLALEGQPVDLARVAAELGYADQAHFARDFKSLVGLSPSQYRAQSRVGARPGPGVGPAGPGPAPGRPGG